MSSKSVLILGSGAIGGKLAEKLSQEGMSVTVIRKSEVALPKPVKTLFWDICDAQKAPTLEEKPDTVFAILAPREKTPEAYQSLYISGLGNFTNHLSGHDFFPSRLFFVSSTIVFGDQKGKRVTEESETSPDNFRGDTLLKAEENLRVLPFKTTVIRFSGIYAPHRAKRLRNYACGNYNLETDPQGWLNLIHEADCVGVLSWLTKLENPDPLYIASDTSPTLVREYFRWIANELHIPEPIFHPPSHHLPSKQCSSEALVKAGYRFIYPTYREGLAEILEELRENKAKGK